MKIFIITPEENRTDETKKIEEFISADVTAIHIRKPQMSLFEMRKYLNNLGKNTRFCVLHHHHRLSEEFQVKGLHFTEKDRKNGKPQLFKNKKLTLSSSFHNIQDVINETFAFDYGFISPVFDSISKKGYKAAFSQEKLIELTKNTPFPLVALGGVTKNKVDQLEKMGFLGAAMLGGAWH